MPVFSYTTIDGESNKIEATDINAASINLRSQKKVIITLKEIGEKSSTDKKIDIESILVHLSFVRSSDIVLFFRQFSSLIRAGVTIVYALQILGLQASKRKLKRLLLNIRTDIEGGANLANALKRHRRHFDLFTISMIETGELGGTLDIVLDRIATSLEERAELRTQTITGFIYPSIVVIMSIIVVSFLVGFVIPKFMPFITGHGGGLPWNTQLLMDATDWLKAYGKYMIIGLIVIFIGICIARRYKKTRCWVDRFKVKIPVIGKIFLYSIAIQFARNMDSLLSSGVSMSSALEATRNTLNNEAAIQAVNAIITDIIRGKSLALSIQGAGFIFPPLVSKIVEVGEESGEMHTAFSSIVDVYEKSLQSYVKRMNALLEPALIITLGSIVGFVIWGLIAGVLAIYAKYGG